MNTTTSEMTVTEKDITKFQGRKRLPDEDFDKYIKRRKVEQFLTEVWLNGSTFWDSSKLGTYCKK